jgi:hypothetical protein
MHRMIERPTRVRWFPKHGARRCAPAFACESHVCRFCDEIMSIESIADARVNTNNLRLSPVAPSKTIPSASLSAPSSASESDSPMWERNNALRASAWLDGPGAESNASRDCSSSKIAAIPSAVRMMAGDSSNDWPRTRRGGVQAGVNRWPVLESLLLGGREGNSERVWI